ncbi:hypothetical protein [Streptomyces sp. AK02-01A]|uniref:hypothetical protein n=1 Tax=Streptomyces sp. AK02-01A TaxID=3028648 RepID=UPI0029A9AD77|nr:hypothetical protein [Streptomyces sp. AK02-01A]MDX3855282.1 hypothetical protein [Streptomyces sp. AK02-01A]
MLLMGAAVTAVCGCVTVEAPRPAPGAVPRPVASSSAAGPGSVESQIVQGPAREALAPIASAGPEPAGSPSPSPVRGTGPERTSGHERPPAAPPRPRQQRPRERPAAQRPLAPAPAAGNVCVLGETYGRWPADSPQARICRNTYGR